MKKLITNGRVITLGDRCQVIEDGAVLISGDEIEAVGRASELGMTPGVEEVIDAGGMVVMPGMINCHMHLYSTFARGIALKDPPPTNFREILERLWWRLDKALTLEDVYVSALIPAIECIKSGTTTIVDHHASPHAVAGSLDEIARATLGVGLRACLAYEVSDRDGEAIADEGIEENVRFARKCAEDKNPRLAASFGLHASFTLSDETLEKCVEAERGVGTGFHIHCAEGIEDVRDSLARYGKRVVERLMDRGILGPRTITAHCVHVNADEIGLLRDTGTNVVHNPESNMGNAVGYADAPAMMSRGVRVGLGTDGFTSDMFESVKVANILHKHGQQNPSASWSEVPEMIFQANRKIARRMFEKPVGVLEPGAYADIIFVNYDPPTPLTAGNFYGHVLFGMSGGIVDTTIVGGEVVMRGREVLSVDEHEAAARARELAAKVWERF